MSPSRTSIVSSTLAAAAALLTAGAAPAAGRPPGAPAPVAVTPVASVDGADGAASRAIAPRAADAPTASAGAPAAAGDGPPRRTRGRVSGELGGVLGSWTNYRQALATKLRLPGTGGRRVDRVVLVAQPLKGFVEPGTPTRRVVLADEPLRCSSSCGGRRVATKAHVSRIAHDGRYRLSIVLRRGSRTIAEVRAAGPQLRIDRTPPTWDTKPEYWITEPEGVLRARMTRWPPPPTTNELQPWQAGYGGTVFRFSTKPTPEHPNGQTVFAHIPKRLLDKMGSEDGIALSPPEPGVRLTAQDVPPTTPPAAPAG
ncbi:hypothetical protein AB0L40_04325 [Patulibacter sp. NPDC049589]|uniref:hypothetical protein n=1 Tax=Patulibacter sp. NPDC049589 TaxID=3154731 RepID=UPI00342174AA